MSFLDALKNALANTFGNGLLKQESDVKMRLESELEKQLGSGRVTTEYKFKYTKEDQTYAESDILVWNKNDQEKPDYALEVKYLLSGNDTDIHGNTINNNGSCLDKFVHDLKKIKDIKSKETLQGAYAIYITDNSGWYDSACKEARDQVSEVNKYRKDNVLNGDGGKTTLYFVVAIA